MSRKSLLGELLEDLDLHIEDEDLDECETMDDIYDRAYREEINGRDDWSEEEDKE